MILVATYYDPATGRISGGGTAPRTDLIANLPAGHAMIDGDWHPALWWVVDGAAVARPEAPPAVVTTRGIAVAPELPPGTTFHLRTPGGAESEVVPDAGVIAVPEPGQWRLTTVPPFPWRTLTQAIQIEE